MAGGMFTTVIWQEEGKDTPKKVGISLVKIKPEDMVDRKSIIWKDKDGNPIKQLRKVMVDGKPLYLGDGDVKNIWSNGQLDGEELIEIPKEDRVSYELTDDGKEETISEYESNLKKGSLVDFTKLVPANQIDKFLYTDVYEITATEEEMWDLYQFAKYLVDNNVIAVSNEIVATKGFKVTAGVIVAEVDASTGTFVLQMRRVTQKIEPSIRNAIPSGPFVPKAEPSKGAKATAKKLF